MLEARVNSWAQYIRRSLGLMDKKDLVEVEMADGDAHNGFYRMTDLGRRVLASHQTRLKTYKEQRRKTMEERIRARRGGYA